MNWRKLIIPIFIALIISMAGFVWTQTDKKIEGNANQIEKLDDKKVDNETLKLLIQQLKETSTIQLKHQKEELNRIYQEIKDIKKKENGK